MSALESGSRGLAPRKWHRGRSGSEAGVESKVQLLLADDASKRNNAIRELGSLGPIARPALRPCSRRCAIRPLTGRSFVKGRRARRPQLRSDRLSRIAPTDPRVLDCLFAALEDPSIELQCHAARTLAALNPRANGLLALVIDRFKKWDAALPADPRICFLEAIAAFGMESPGVIEAILGALESAAPHVRQTACELLVGSRRFGTTSSPPCSRPSQTRRTATDLRRRRTPSDRSATGRFRGSWWP